MTEVTLSAQVLKSVARHSSTFQRNYASQPAYSQIQGVRRRTRDYIVDKLNRDLKSLSTKDLISLLAYLTSTGGSHTSQAHAERIVQINGVDKIKSVLSQTLATSTDPMDNYRLLADEVIGVGPVAASGVLNILYPQQCGIWTHRVRGGWRSLKLDRYVDSQSQSLTPHEYEEFNSVCRAIGDVLRSRGVSVVDQSTVTDFLTGVGGFEPTVVLPEPIVRPLHVQLRPTASVEPNCITIDVFYGTNRLPTRSLTLGRRYDRNENPGKLYGPKRGDAVHLGLCEVSIPRDPRHTKGNIERPKLWKLELWENPEKHLVVQATQPLTTEDFAKRMNAWITDKAASQAFVFIHGFNVSFEEAAWQVAQLSYDLGFDGATVMFTWPSKGKLSKAAYTHDQNNAQYSVEFLEKFLENVIRSINVTKIHIIAHSLGNWVLTHTLMSIGKANGDQADGRFNQVVLAAPDIDASVFTQQLVPCFRHIAERLTLYAAKNDIALKYSQKINGNYARAGYAKDGIILVEGVDTIDVSAVNATFIGHNYWSSNKSVVTDLFTLINQGHPPSQRFLTPIPDKKTPKYWKFDRWKN